MKDLYYCLDVPLLSVQKVCSVSFYIQKNQSKLTDSSVFQSLLINKYSYNFIYCLRDNKSVKYSIQLYNLIKS